MRVARIVALSMSMSACIATGAVRGGAAVSGGAGPNDTAGSIGLAGGIFGLHATMDVEPSSSSTAVLFGGEVAAVPQIVNSFVGLRLGARVGPVVASEGDAGRAEVVGAALVPLYFGGAIAIDLAVGGVLGGRFGGDADNGFRGGGFANIEIYWMCITLGDGCINSVKEHKARMFTTGR